jgi:dephospho-CoA kinase
MKQKNRWLLQTLGQKMREIDSRCWINNIFKRAEEYINQNNNVVIVDCRQEDEYIEGLNKGYFPIRIVCDRDIAIQRLIKRDGYCDTSLLDAPVEVGTRNIQMLEINNNGTFEDLYKQIDELIKWMEENFND